MTRPTIAVMPRATTVQHERVCEVRAGVRPPDDAISERRIGAAVGHLICRLFSDCACRYVRSQSGVRATRKS